MFEIPDSVRKWMGELARAWGEAEDAKIMGHKHEWRTKHFYTRDSASGMYCQCGAELDLGDVENAINVLEDIACDPCLSPDANAARARQALQGVT